ncbi:hypothetical protein [Nocardia pseudobrasiliensis]|uniref:hypothetical protein n=1 Tax=Nocardia pseudobrasiliensis TaxID=45979 RepID=UPI000A88FB9B|nr:hypothetical protein [Nocardia pseudobrasiliensis]
MRESLRAAVFAGAALVLVVLIVALGWAYPPRASVIATDRLGPDANEPIADYLARAKLSLSGTDSDDHWALASFTTGITPDRIPDHTDGLRIAQVLHHVPLDRVLTPVLTFPVPAGDQAAIATASSAAATLDHTPPLDDRAARIAKVSATRLRSGCPCTIALILRGRLNQLRALSSHNDIRSIEALPADAGIFAVTPLLPEYTDRAAPGPDDGPIPEN